MKPGKELDALIAEKVMGWRYFKEYGSERVELFPPSGEVHHVDRMPPFYSTDIAAAWEVVENFMSRGFHFTVGSYLTNNVKRKKVEMVWAARFSLTWLSSVTVVIK